jgi:hypothetical protein
MSDEPFTPEAPNNTPESSPEAGIRWGEHAPRGGRAVLKRILERSLRVPMFFGQTLIKSLRDQGYNNTTTALCEFVDNSIQWGATEVRVYIAQLRNEPIRILVYDNGGGMAPTAQKVAMAFGGSMAFDARTDISRFGLGMKTAALSISPSLDNFTWQEPRAYYSLTLDVNEVGSTRRDLLEMPEPQLNDELPSDVVDILTRPMTWPKNPQETQTLLVDSREDLHEKLGRSGTIIYLPECDRLSYKKVQTLAEHAIKEMGRVYRRFIDRGLKLYVNNRLVEAFDPTYWMQSARHVHVEGLTETETRSRLVGSWPIDVPVADGASKTTRVKVKLFALPYEAWSGLPRKVLKNDLHVYSDFTVSFLRNDREVDVAATVPKLKLRKHHTNNWLRLEIEFTGEADEGFGVASNKQGVRLKEYVAEKILAVIGEHLTELRKAIMEQKARQASLKSGSKVSAAERRATDAEPLQGKPLPPEPESPEQQAALEQNLRALAVTLKQEGESDEDAFQRIKASRFITLTVHDEDKPFYRCDFKHGRVLLTLNTAHPFHEKVWEPLSQLARSAEAASGEDEDAEINPDVANTCSEVLVALQLMLLSLARAQSQMSGYGSNEEDRRRFDTLRKEWSSYLETMLTSGLTSSV